MAKKILFLLYILFNAALCFGRETFSFYISPYAGYGFSRSDEIVYEPDCRDLVSLLEWKSCHLISSGLSFTAATDTKEFSLCFDYAFPLSGSMTDRDWEYNNLYSITTHPVKTIPVINCSINLAGLLGKGSGLGAYAVLDTFYNYSDYKAGNGTGMRNNKQIQTYGIDYKKHSLFAFAGLMLKTDPWNGFCGGVKFCLCPFGLQYDTDHHHGVTHPFSTIDSQFSLFSKFKLELSCSQTIKQTFGAELKYSCIFGIPDRGKMYTDSVTGTMEYAGKISGANYTSRGVYLILHCKL